MKKGIVVLGMHRSGTSMLTGALQILGADLGDNVGRGVSENKDFRKINNQILKSLNSRWDDTKALPKGWINYQGMSYFKEGIKKLILSNFKNSKLWAIKCPRICLLLPLYLKIFGELDISPDFIIIERKNIEIAKSLAARNMFFLSKSLALCKKYKQSIDKFSKGYKCIRITFDEMIYNTEKTINKISSSLDIPFKGYIEVREKLKEFINPNRKHHNVSFLKYPLLLMPCLFPQIYSFKRKRQNQQQPKVRKGQVRNG